MSHLTPLPKVGDMRFFDSFAVNFELDFFMTVGAGTRAAIMSRAKKSPFFGFTDFGLLHQISGQFRLGHLSFESGWT